MKIYFAASLQGIEIERIEIYKQIINFLSVFGEVLTEKIGNKDFQLQRKDLEISYNQIHDYDLNLITQSDIIVAEITSPSLGVGYEIGRAFEQGKSIFCIYNEEVKDISRISKIIRGIPSIKIAGYKSLGDLQFILRNYFNNCE